MQCYPCGRVQRHRDVWGKGGKSPRMLSSGTRWGARWSKVPVPFTCERNRQHAFDMKRFDCDPSNFGGSDNVTISCSAGNPTPLSIMKGGSLFTD
jgi:hypothetical protein